MRRRWRRRPCRRDQPPLRPTAGFFSSSLFSSRAGRLHRPIACSSAPRACGGGAVYMRRRPRVLSSSATSPVGGGPGDLHMLERTKPPFRADHVGSLIRPEALIKAREEEEKGEVSQAELKRIQQAAIRDVVRMQEELGLKLVTDGEYNRHSWHRDFM